MPDQCTFHLLLHYPCGDRHPLFLRLLAFSTGSQVPSTPCQPPRASGSSSPDGALRKFEMAQTGFSPSSLANDRKTTHEISSGCGPVEPMPRGSSRASLVPLSHFRSGDRESCEGVRGERLIGETRWCGSLWKMLDL